MKIAIDIDEVLADSMPKMLQFHKNKTGLLVTEEDLYKMPYLGFFGKSEETSIATWLDFFESKYSEIITPVSGSEQAVKKLAKNNELFVVTGRPYSTKQKTSDWIEAYFPKMFSNIYFDNNDSYKDNLSKNRTKSEICQDLSAKILIDDLLRFTNNCHKEMQVLLFNRPWNQGKIPENVKRIFSWEEITNFIETNGY